MWKKSKSKIIQMKAVEHYVEGKVGLRFDFHFHFLNILIFSTEVVTRSQTKLFF